jgi:molybdopterin/thiamine biosynthesis adenylyltransferase
VQLTGVLLFCRYLEDMNDQQLLRYSRHILLDELGIEGQQQLLAARALVIGAGGLGSPVAMYLTAAGVGSITVVDDDAVDLTNLQRQILHDTSRVVAAKVDSAVQTLRSINADVQVHALRERADATRLMDLVGQADVVIDCSDNFATRQAVNAACVARAKPLVSGAAIGFDAQISVYDTRPTSNSSNPCYACVFPPGAQFDEVSCATMGVLAPLVGIIGSMQAAEALKLLTDVGSSLAGRLMMLDARNMKWTEIAASRSPDCPVCAHRNGSS